MSKRLAGVLDQVFGNGEETKENRNNRPAKSARVVVQNPYDEGEEPVVSQKFQKK